MMKEKDVIIKIPAAKIVINKEREKGSLNA